MTLPTRIQRHRTKGWKAPTGAVVISRPSAFGNPFPVAKHGPTVAVVLFRLAMHQRQRQEPDAVEALLDRLAGYDYLMCWCPLVDHQGNPVPCHGDVWIELLAARTTQAEEGR